MNSCSPAEEKAQREMQVSVRRMSSAFQHSALTTFFPYLFTELCLEEIIYIYIFLTGGTVAEVCFQAPLICSKKRHNCNQLHFHRFLSFLGRLCFPYKRRDVLEGHFFSYESFGTVIFSLIRD